MLDHMAMEERMPPGASLKGRATTRGPSTKHRRVETKQCVWGA